MDKYTEKIALYMEDMLTDRERTELEIHLTSCSTCQAEHIALKQIDQLLMSIPMAAPAVNFVAQVGIRLDRRINRRRTMTGMAIIGAILLMAAGLLVWSVANSGLTTLSFLSNFNLLGDTVGLLGAVLAGLGTLFKVGLLVIQAMAQVVRHPAFWGYVALTVGVISLWAQLLRRINLAQRPVGV